MASSIQARKTRRRQWAGADPAQRRDLANRAYTGGDALVATLLEHGVDTAFGVPGESYLAVLEALRAAQERLRFVITRHESGATFAACAYARLARKPGVAFVTRGPGATNGSIGIHTARQDSVPLVLFIGQVPSDQRGRESFQEIDYHRMLGPMTKAVFEPHTPHEVAAAAAEAFAIAVDGRPGPVAVALPEDVTEGETDDTPVPQPRARRAVLPAPDDIRAIAERIAQAERPVAIAGEMVGFEGANEALAAFAEAHGVGVFSSFRQQGVVPCAHPAFLGTLGLALPPYQEALLAEADLVLALGTRLDLATTVDDRVIHEARFVVHVYPDADASSLPRRRLRLPPAAPGARRSGQCSTGSDGNPPGPRSARSISPPWCRRSPNGCRRTPPSSTTPVTSQPGCCATSPMSIRWPRPRRR